MKILVTGADGFIGSHLVERLVKEGHSVTALTMYNINNNLGNLEFIDKKKLKYIKVLRGDIRDYDFVLKNFKKQDLIIHLAALIGIPYSYVTPNSYIDTNIKGTLNILSVLQQNQNLSLIHTSTSETYGTAKFVPITENHPLEAQSPYAASKIGADQLAMSFFKSYETPVTILRPFNTYGPRQSMRAIIPTIANQFLQNKKILQLGHLSPTRDYNYVEDIVSAFCCSINNKKCVGEIINLGTGYEISVKNLAILISKIFDKKIQIKSEDLRKRPKKSEVERLCADNTKARKILKWKPVYAGKTGLEKGLRKTISWFKQHFNRKNKNNETFYL